MEAGVIDAFRFKGETTERLTESVKPLMPVIVTVEVPGIKGAIVSWSGEISIVKSGAITVTETNTGWLKELLVPVTTTV